METIVEALKNLYAAFGGDADDIKNTENIADAINTLAAYISEGGVLPLVTTTDNGKILKVVDGAWAIGTDLIE